MTKISDITIIGCGAIGLLTAKEFVDAGYTVTLIDKSLSGQESSWAGGGILLPLYPWRQAEAISTLVVESLKQYPHLSHELFQKTQIDPEWFDCGLLICKNPDINLALEWCESHQIKYQLAEQTVFKSLNTEQLNPLWLPEIAQVRNPRLLKSLKAYLLDLKVTFIENSEVMDCRLTHDKVTSIQTKQGHLPVNQLIICTGAWTQKLTQQLFPESLTKPAISPVKGQMLLFDTKPNTLPYMVLDNGYYLIPRKDGKILVGSSIEQTDFAKPTTIEVKQKLSDFAAQLFPTLKRCPLIQHWAGLRPATPQGIPYIAKHPEFKNVAINAGHFRNGLVMGPASAKLMADLILERTPCISPVAYKLALN